MRVVTLATLLLVSVVPTVAHTQSAADVALAETLFREGQELYAAGDFERGCPKFKASYELAGGLGTLLNLARCYESEGKVASAWALYVDLESLAERANQEDRRRIARERIDALQPMLSRLQLNVAHGVEGLELYRSGVLVDRAAFGLAVPVDPGTYVIEATQPGYERWSTTVTVDQPGSTQALDVPPLVESPKAPAAAPPAKPAAPRAPPAPMPAPPTKAEGVDGLLVAGGVTAGVGLVLAGVATGYAVSAANAWDDAGCEGGTCPTAAAQLLSEDANSQAGVATGFSVGAGVGIASGLGLLVLSVVLDEEAHVGLHPRGSSFSIFF